MRLGTGLNSRVMFHLGVEVEVEFQLRWFLWRSSPWPRPYVSKMALHPATTCPACPTTPTHDTEPTVRIHHPRCHSMGEVETATVSTLGATLLLQRASTVVVAAHEFANRVRHGVANHRFAIALHDDVSPPSQLPR